jgi:hypothetical protein
MSSRRDTRLNHPPFQRLPKFVAVISLVGDQNLRLRHRSKYQSIADMIVQLPLGQKHFQRPAILIADDMKF